MSKQNLGRKSMRASWMARAAVGTGALGLVAASWMTMPLAMSQAAALARWTLNGPSSVTNFSANEGVTDTAGLPAPTFNGDPVGSPSFCSAYSPAIAPPNSGSNSDCMYLNGSSFIKGDSGESLFSNNETGDPNGPASGTNDGNPNVGHYTGSRTLMAWVRLHNASWLSGDQALISIGRENWGNQEDCNSVDPGTYYDQNGQAYYLDANGQPTSEETANSHCTEFALWVDSSGHFNVGHTRGATNQYLTLGPSITCTNTSYTLSSTTASEWFFVVATYDAGAAEDDNNSSSPLGHSTRIYVNGDLCVHGNIYRPYTEVSSSSRWAIGGFINNSGDIYDTNPATGHPGFHGFIDDARVFDRALPQGEIETLYASSNNGG